jgi:plasmid stability protein
MADLLVRGVDDGIVQALKKRAGVHGRSAEAEHRAILEAALMSPPRRNLAELLASMPDVGLDTDFERYPC